MIYLDNNATTRCDPRVVNTMLPYFSTSYGNPSSSHIYGTEAREAVKKARELVAKLVGAGPNEIVFTSGATESNNTTILGLSRGINKTIKNGIITTQVEHKSVLEPCRSLIQEGFDVHFLSVNNSGRVCITDDQLSKKCFLLSVQLANNETGVIQPVKDIVCSARRTGAFIHCDAAQAAGKIRIDVKDMDVDFLSFSAHKMYGPKGIGALYMRGGPQNNPIVQLLFGGGQEGGFRAGTLNVPGIIGFGKAAEIAIMEMEEESGKIRSLRDHFEEKMSYEIGEIKINGADESRLPGTTSIVFPGIEADLVLSNTHGLVISAGSACASEGHSPSHVLKAMGLSDEDAFCTLRFSIGRFNDGKEIDETIDILSRICRSIRHR
jgi:cysteine desulfurase